MPRARKAESPRINGKESMMQNDQKNLSTLAKTNAE